VPRRLCSEEGSESEDILKDYESCNEKASEKWRLTTKIQSALAWRKCGVMKSIMAISGGWRGGIMVAISVCAAWWHKTCTSKANETQ
jgi:hypothetical protein